MKRRSLFSALGAMLAWPVAAKAAEPMVDVASRFAACKTRDEIFDLYRKLERENAACLWERLSLGNDYASHRAKQIRSRSSMD